MLHVALVVAGIILFIERDSFKGLRSQTHSMSVYTSNSHTAGTGTAYASWRYYFVQSGFNSIVGIAEPQVIVNNKPPLDDPIRFLESDSPAAQYIRNQYHSYSFDPTTHYAKRWPEWHKEEIRRLQQQGYSGHSTRFNYIKAITWYGLLTATGLSAAYFVGSWHIRRRVIAHLRAIRSANCPSCAYEIDRRVSQICPECGLRLAREAKLIELLHYGGYRGLKRFQKLEAEGAWKN